MNVLKGKYRKSIPLASVRTDLCCGRAKQLTDEHARELAGLLEDGIEFIERPLLTEDSVVVYGHHRVEAKRAYFLAHNVAIDQQMLDADVLPIAWDEASDEVKEKLKDVAFKENAKHIKVKPSTFVDLRVQVGRMLDRGLTLKQMISELAPEVSPAQVRRAFAEHQRIATQAGVKHAQELVAQGTSVKKALAVAGLPADYDLPEKGSTRRDTTTHRWRNDAKNTSDGWSKVANRKIEDYRETGYGQSALTDMATSMTAVVAILHRKAESVRIQVEAVIQERAKRERR
jgi:hypothetical protein